MIRAPVWVWMILGVLFVISAITGVGGFTFQWRCDDYAKRKAAEVFLEGYDPYDTYTFVGLGVGFCEPGYSDD